MANTTIWNSQLVQQSLEKLRMGIPTDLTCFHMGDIELKTGNLLYQLTHEEIEEFHNCSRDIVYFVEKYCRFLTDTGRIEISKLIEAFEPKEICEKLNLPLDEVKRTKKQPHPFKILTGDLLSHYPFGKIFIIDDCLG